MLTGFLFHISLPVGSSGSFGGSRQRIRFSDSHEQIDFGTDRFP